MNTTEKSYSVTVRSYYSPTYKDIGTALGNGIGEEGGKERGRRGASPGGVDTDQYLYTEDYKDRMTPGTEGLGTTVHHETTTDGDLGRGVGEESA